MGASPLPAHLVGTRVCLPAPLHVGGVVPLFAQPRVVAACARMRCAVRVCVCSPGRRTGWGWLNNPLKGLLLCGAVARRRDA